MADLDLAALERLCEQARDATDGDGDWSECYAEDVTALIARVRELERLATELDGALYDDPHDMSDDAMAAWVALSAALLPKQGKKGP